MKKIVVKGRLSDVRVRTYLFDHDAALKKLERLTARTIAQRIARNDAAVDIAAMVADADRSAKNLQRIVNALIDAKGRLIGIDVRGDRVRKGTVGDTFANTRKRKRGISE
jgi:hypothetical protein